MTETLLSSVTKKSNKALQLTNNTPLRSVLWSTEFNRYVTKVKI